MVTDSDKLSNGQMYLLHDYIHIDPTNDLSEHIFLPIINGYKQLKVLNLHCPSMNLFSNKYKIIDGVINN